LHGANRLGGNSLSDLVVFGKRAGEFAAKFAKEHGAGLIDHSFIDKVAQSALEPFERGMAGENPFAVQHELQSMMQDLVGIVRVESEMETALGEIAKLKARAVKAGIAGNREYNGGWHTALDLDNLLTVSDVITRRRSSAKKAAARISAMIFQTRARSGRSTICASRRMPRRSQGGKGAYKTVDR